MIVNYQLHGSVTIHQGIFDTTGFWVRFEEETEGPLLGEPPVIEGYKIYNHGSFCYYTKSREDAEDVMGALVDAVNFGYEWSDERLGWIKCST